MFDSIQHNKSLNVGGAPESYIPLLLRDLSVKRSLVFIADDDSQANRIAEALKFFSPDTEILFFPAWDCLPYDRVSPHRDILAKRIEVLHRLSHMDRRHIVVTTMSAFLQKVPPSDWIRNRGRSLRKNDQISQMELKASLLSQAYMETGTVNEPGEFAQRGGILDIFPAGSDHPIRLDFFGDELEDIRTFDAVTQRTLGKLEEISLLPVNEFEFNKETIERFRIRYREQFGSGDDDPLYEAVSAGRHYPGMEHWLSLFRQDLVPLLEYFPEEYLCLSRQAIEAKDSRIETIVDFYSARQNFYATGKKNQSSVYKPLPPDHLYLTNSDWETIAKHRIMFTFHPGRSLDHEGWVDGGAKMIPDFAPIRKNPDLNIYDETIKQIKAAQQKGQKVLLSASSLGASERLGQVFREHGYDTQQFLENSESFASMPTSILGRCVLPLEHGFTTDRLLFLTDQDILGDRLDHNRARKRKKPNQVFTELGHFEMGHFVVHQEHGIGRYEGLETLDIGGAPHACLKIIYQGGDKLFVPVENIDVMSKYGGEDAIIELDKLGGTAWQARKARVKKRILEMAGKLISIAAHRAVASFEPLQPPGGLYEEFCAGFPYAETEDQERAIEDVLSDFSSGKPMDRLICGDVGFGKTEIALRAAFVMAASGKQVVIVAPTTLLARQHFNTFSQRFQPFPIKLAHLSRLTGAKEIKEAKEKIARGEIDITIGTQAVLAKDISFAKLGLVIIDEEQHFGVGQKERLKELREGVHVLTLTATPIPRTLQMALTGLRDMSVIATPPIDRLAVRTFVLPVDPVILREAMMREHFRGGQIFYVCPRIEDLDKVAASLRDLVPELKIVMAHGRMTPTQLEKAMNAFYDGAYDILLSTNIVESGLDIPRANTMIIHRADIFGLAQLYQLRGRIGRSKLRGYCYLTVPAGKSLNNTAERRLDVMQTLDQLGAGFNLASQDLDIRGAGNLLGEEQSGQVKEVGVELYQQMLQEAVQFARKETTATDHEWLPQINLGLAVLIPEDYVADLSLRLGLYRRLGDLHDIEEIESFAAEMIDRFGPLPVSFQNLLKVVEIKALCRKANIEKLEAGPKGAILAFRNKQFAQPDKLIAMIAQSKGRWLIRPDQRLVYRADWENIDQRAIRALRIAQALVSLLQ